MALRNTDHDYRHSQSDENHNQLAIWLVVTAHRSPLFTKEVTAWQEKE